MTKRLLCKLGFHDYSASGSTYQHTPKGTEHVPVRKCSHCDKLGLEEGIWLTLKVLGVASWLILLGLAVLFLSGCHFRDARERMWRAQCLEYGFKPDTDKYAECLLSLDDRMPL